MARINVNPAMLGTEQVYAAWAMTHFDKTVLQITPRLDSGGAERTTLEIAEAISRAGGRALVMSAGGRLSSLIKNAGGEVILAPVDSKNPYVIWRNAGRVAQIIKSEGVDLVHARSRAPAWSALMATKRTGVPFVTTYHGAYAASGPVKRVYNSSMLRADRVIANSRFTAERIFAGGGIDPARLSVIPRGVDLRSFDPAKVSAGRVNQAVKAWGLGEKQGFRVLLPARLAPWKGHETAIVAVQAIKERQKHTLPTGQGPGLTLVFCGGAQGKQDFERRLRARMDECGVRNMIHLVGDCADMPAAYAWADVVIAPSTRPEAFGRVIVEAAAMAKPVIASAHGGACETVIDGETGVLVAPGDAIVLADAIERMRDLSSDACNLMGEKARARTASVYSSAAMCDATLGVYQSLLAEQV